MKQKPKKQQMKNSKKNTHPAVWIVSGLAVIIAAYMIIERVSRDPRQQTAPRVETASAVGQNTGSSAFAPDATMENIGGDMIQLSSYRGKVVMLNFWATWCGPCKAEIPDFINLQNQYGDEGLEIVGVSLDKPGKEADVRAFVEAKGINYDVLFGDGAVADAFGGVRSIPTTFLIDREGHIQVQKIGLRPKEEWENAIKQLL